MNVFDFDNTIYRGDSTADFILFNLKKQPSLLLSALPCAGFFLLHWLHLCTITEAKQSLFRIFRRIPSPEERLSEFWSGHLDRIKPWYRSIHREDDLVISASPEFLVRPACEAFQIRHVIGSPVDMHTGSYSGKNCSGQEKVVRFRESYPDAVIQNFFSDSLSDSPIAACAEQSYLVKDNTFFPWPSH